MSHVTEHRDMATLKARIQKFLRSRDGLDLSVPQIWEAAPWHKQGEQEERGTWDWVTVPMLEGVLRDMNNDRNWRVREVVHNPRYRFEARPEDIGT